MKNIGKYEILEKIGSGGFGTVYKGRDPFIKRIVAIKTCSTEGEEIRERFFREVEIIGNLEHPNITVVHDFGIQEDVPYIVEEYLTGEDLTHIIKGRRALSDRQKIDILLQLARGLEYAHSQQIIHRDIKPSNIRILENGRVKLMDFGIAKLAHTHSGLTQTGMTLGTASYLARNRSTASRWIFAAMSSPTAWLRMSCSPTSVPSKATPCRSSSSRSCTRSRDPYLRSG
jgi:serine/threonine protein kinase